MKIVLTLVMLGANVSSALAAAPNVPDDARDLAQRAVSKAEANCFDEAAGLCRVIIQEHPDCAWAWANLGTTRMAQGRYDDALEALTHATALDPKDVASITNLGYTEYQLNNFPEALKHLQAAVALNPDDSGARRVLSLVYGKLGRQDEAQAEAAKADAVDKKREVHGLQDAVSDDKTRNSS